MTSPQIQWGNWLISFICLFFAWVDLAPEFSDTARFELNFEWDQHGRSVSCEVQTCAGKLEMGSDIMTSEGV